MVHYIQTALFFMAPFIVSQVHAMDPNLGLLVACGTGNFEQARSFVDQGASIIFQDTRGNTPFHLAAQHGKKAFSLLSYFIDKGVQTNDDKILCIANNEGVTIFSVLDSYKHEKKKNTKTSVRSTATYSTKDLFVES
ncbi:hypothetical protein Noda2021_04400 [Candidatus Dependentiae bacterium Noda2021]|nr:hypothetical protein Noda2021_04400 [Candidatus Dependentiae bacterium Noda2021]